MLPLAISENWLFPALLVVAENPTFLLSVLADPENKNIRKTKPRKRRSCRKMWRVCLEKTCLSTAEEGWGKRKRSRDPCEEALLFGVVATYLTNQKRWVLVLCWWVE